MLKRVDTRTYPPTAYDDELCLKPSPLLWCTLIFLSRALLMPLVMGMGHYFGVNADAMAMLRDLWRPEFLIPAAIALPILIGLFWRVPQAPDALRWSWGRGRILLLLATLTDLALTVGLITRSEGLSLALFICAACDLYLLAYLGLSRRVRDTFKDFPARRTA